MADFHDVMGDNRAATAAVLDEARKVLTKVFGFALVE
jgi:hypothetical protein